MPMECDVPDLVADILRYLLIDLGVGSNPAVTDQALDRVWPIHADSEPDDPDECITVYSPTSAIDGQSPFDGDLWERPSWSIRVRSRTKESGKAKANAVKVAVCGVYWQVVTVPDPTGTGGTDYRVETMLPTSGVNSIGQEQGTGRFLFTINGTCTLDPNP